MAKESETKKLQQQLQLLLKEVGWDLKKLADEIAIADEMSDFREEIDAHKEYEKIRKLLSRSTTKPETLHYYLNFVIEQNKDRKLYKVPELNDDILNQQLADETVNWQAIFDDIEKICYQHFSNEYERKQC